MRYIYQMTRKNNFSTILNKIFNSWNSSTDPSIISNILIIIKRNIQISSHKNLLSLQFGTTQISHTLLRHRHHSSYSSPAHCPHLRRHLHRQQRVSCCEPKSAEWAGAEEWGEVDAGGGWGGGWGRGFSGGEEWDGCGGCSWSHCRERMCVFVWDFFFGVGVKWMNEGREGI